VKEAQVVVGSVMYDLIRYNLVPPVFLLFFTGITQWLVAAGNKQKEFHVSNLVSPGSLFSWSVVSVFLLWSFLSLKVPAKTFLGPATPTGYVPVYSANGVQYYLVSLVSYLTLVYAVPSLPLSIWLQFDQIVSSLNIFSLVLCVFLLIKGHVFPEVPEGAKSAPLPYQFYAGIELHPRLFGVDIKQWTNCRAGMMGWAVLVINFAIASIQLNGFKLGPIVNAVLINLYLLKFFYWETGYFNTLDITLDRAGYYLCWGCLTWVQVFYTFSAYFLVANPTQVSNPGAFTILVFGLLSITLNYMADYQKEKFKTSGGECTIWGRKAKFIQVEYKTHDGKKKKSKLLISGFWGMSRHMNYVFELMLALSWSLPALGYGVYPFFYFIFLVILLVHRTFRDDEKCSAKYGDGWIQYCKQVPYKMIPFIF